MDYQKLFNCLIGKPLDPLKTYQRHPITLVALLAWIGLGADSLSSACYGPEEAFLTLGPYTYLGIYLAVGTTLTIFILALAYNQVITLFPGGGGGYKVATHLIHPNAGVISGSALIVDFVLTIAISTASGVDALFSLFSPTLQPYKLTTEILVVLFLLILNLKGVKESIKILAPIFLGFVLSHLILISYGIYQKSYLIPTLITQSIQQTQILSQENGWLFTIAIFLRAYSLGSGTYTGIETIANNSNQLASPRARTGRFAMLWMALSLSITAGGIILLYLLWNITPQHGKTLNAVLFQTVMHTWDTQRFLLPTILLLETGLLFVAANTGYLGGPAILAKMAIDQWVPEQFRHLSTRLVTHNGVIAMAIATLAVLWWSNGQVKVLIVMYSINVFITFTLSLFGLTVYWWKKRYQGSGWFFHLFISFVGVMMTGSILGIILIEKYSAGGWITLFITSILIMICLFIKRQYRLTSMMIKKIVPHVSQEHLIEQPIPDLDPQQSTAILFIDHRLEVGMHTLLRIQWLFPNVYKNFIFLSTTEIDIEACARVEQLEHVQQETEQSLNYFVNYCHMNGLPSAKYQTVGTDMIKSLVDLATEVKTTYPDSMFFAGELVFKHETWITQWLHNHTATILQKQLNLQGLPTVLIPMQLS